MNAVDDTGPLADPLAKVRRLVDTAVKQGLLRALGGVALYLLAPDGKPRIPRRVKDIDGAVPRGSGRPAARLLQQAGYMGDEMFNALHGSRRLLFFDPHRERQLDVFVGESSMCHEIPLTAQAEPKTMKWRPRGQVVDKVRWYQQPEEEQGPRTGTRP
jgi:hypothetical protein